MPGPARILVALSDRLLLFLRLRLASRSLLGTAKVTPLYRYLTGLQMGYLKPAFLATGLVLPLS
jgi:hypothetical protein